MGIIVHGIWCLRGKKMKMKMLQHYMVVKAQTLTETSAFQFAIRIDSIRYANRFVLQKNYCIVSAKNKLTSMFAAFNTNLDVFNSSEIV